jgi:hypothetical protein
MIRREGYRLPMTRSFEMLAQLGRFNSSSAVTVGAIVAVMAMAAYWMLRT